MKGITEFSCKSVNLRYNPETGECWKQWKNGDWVLITPGTSSEGYTIINLNGRNYSLHRVLAEVFLNRGIPLTEIQHVDHIKHIDGSHAQDRLSNLRIVSSSQNSMNQRLRRTNKSGYKGVRLHQSPNKWRASITSQGRCKDLGLFTTPESAALAYDKAAKELHGEFAKLNFS